MATHAEREQNPGVPWGSPAWSATLRTVRLQPSARQPTSAIPPPLRQRQTGLLCLLPPL